MNTTTLLAALVLAASLAPTGCKRTTHHARSRAPAPAPASTIPTAPPSLTLLDIPPGWRAIVEGDRIRLETPEEIDNDIIVRPVPRAATPADALADLPALISEDMHDFKPSTIRDITLAGQPAKHILGSGTEADDGSPSSAEVFIFTVARKVYIACVHGEGSAAADLRPIILKTLNSAQPR